VTAEDDYTDVTTPGAEPLLLELQRLGRGPLPTPCAALQDAFENGVPMTSERRRRRTLALAATAAVAFGVVLAPAAFGAPSPGLHLISTVVRDLTPDPKVPQHAPFPAPTPPPTLPPPPSESPEPSDGASGSSEAPTGSSEAPTESSGAATESDEGSSDASPTPTQSSARTSAEDQAGRGSAAEATSANESENDTGGAAHVPTRRSPLPITTRGSVVGSPDGGGGD
jgi:hypothetical protein